MINFSRAINYKGQPPIAGSPNRESVWFYKNPDNKRSGILFGTVVKREGTDSLVTIASGGQTTLSPERISLIGPHHSLDINGARHVVHRDRIFLFSVGRWYIIFVSITNCKLGLTS